MFLRAHQRKKDGKQNTYWPLVETAPTADGPRRRTLCYLGELNDSSQSRWLKTVEVFNEQGESRQLKLFPAHVEPPANDPNVAQILVNKVRLERSRQFGPCFLGPHLWRRLELDRLFENNMDMPGPDVRLVASSSRFSNQSIVRARQRTGDRTTLVPNYRARRSAEY